MYQYDFRRWGFLGSISPMAISVVCYKIHGDNVGFTYLLFLTKNSQILYFLYCLLYITSCRLNINVLETIMSMGVNTYGPIILGDYTTFLMNRISDCQPLIWISVNSIFV